MSAWKKTAALASNTVSRCVFAAVLCVGGATMASAQEAPPVETAPTAEGTAGSPSDVAADGPTSDATDAKVESEEGAPPAEGEASAPGTSDGAVSGEEASEGASTEVEGDAATSEGTEQSTEGEGALNLQTADQEYHLKLNHLEGKISDLKFQIFRSKAKLQMLTEEVTGGLGIGSGLVIVHYNDMSEGFFHLVEAHYFLDGKELWQEIDDSGLLLTAKRERSVLEGPMVEGSHTLTVSLVYRGNGTGLFSYLKGYTWRLKDSYTFTVEPGKRVFIQVHGFEQGNFTTELKDRPAIRFDTEIKDQAN